MRRDCPPPKPRLRPGDGEDATPVAERHGRWIDRQALSAAAVEALETVVGPVVEAGDLRSRRERTRSDTETATNLERASPRVVVRPSATTKARDTQPTGRTPNNLPGARRSPVGAWKRRPLVLVDEFDEKLVVDILLRGCRELRFRNNPFGAFDFRCSHPVHVSSDSRMYPRCFGLQDVPPLLRVTEECHFGPQHLCAIGQVDVHVVDVAAGGHRCGQRYRSVARSPARASVVADAPRGERALRMIAKYIRRKKIRSALSSAPLASHPPDARTSTPSAAIPRGRSECSMRRTRSSTRSGLSAHAGVMRGVPARGGKSNSQEPLPLCRTLRAPRVTRPI